MMSKFHTTTTVPVWRLLLYSTVALAVAGWLGFHFDDRRLVIGAAIGVPICMVIVFAAFRFGRSPLAMRHRRAILWLYVLLQVAMIVWAIIDHHAHP